MINFTVPGTPVGKARPRVTRSGRVYTPESTAQAEEAIRQAAQQAMQGWPTNGKPMEGPLAVTIYFVMPIPASWSKKLKDDASSGFIAHTSRPDLDNLIKTVLDAMNGVVYSDDKQVTTIGALKKYGVDPKMMVFVKPE